MRLGLTFLTYVYTVRRYMCIAIVVLAQLHTPPNTHRQHTLSTHTTILLHRTYLVLLEHSAVRQGLEVIIVERGAQVERGRNIHVFARAGLAQSAPVYACSSMAVW